MSVPLNLRFFLIGTLNSTHLVWFMIVINFGVEEYTKLYDFGLKFKVIIKVL